MIGVRERTTVRQRNKTRERAVEGDSNRMALPIETADDFSLVIGGPLFQIFRHAYLSGSALELLRGA
jgi:hypothetical protein